MHRCPRCEGAHAERRTARTYRERAAVALLGYHPYRCLDCGRRFLDRPRTRAAAGKTATRRPHGSTAPSAPVVAITTHAAVAPRRRRRKRWIIDVGNTPLGRSEIYALAVTAALALLVVLAVLRFMWPESTGGVRIPD